MRSHGDRGKDADAAGGGRVRQLLADEWRWK